MNNRQTISLEVCADSAESAHLAQIAGASRIELCTNLNEGGITPSIGQIEAARNLLEIPLYVLIRPRSGDFLYSDTEFEIIKSDIHKCGQAGCDGVVIGILQPDGSIDTDRCYELMQIAKNYPMGVTFHRAIDRSANIYQALEDIIELGCERILTSGGSKTAIEGINNICRLAEKANGRISIMPGAGITSQNIEELVQKTGLSEFHGTFKKRCYGKMAYYNPVFDKDDNAIFEPDKPEIEKVICIANNLDRSNI